MGETKDFTKALPTILKKPEKRTFCNPGRYRHNGQPDMSDFQNGFRFGRNFW